MNYHLRVDSVLYTNVDMGCQQCHRSLTFCQDLKEKRGEFWVEGSTDTPLFDVLYYCEECLYERYHSRVRIELRGGEESDSSSSSDSDSSSSSDSDSSSSSDSDSSSSSDSDSSSSDSDSDSISSNSTTSSSTTSSNSTTSSSTTSSSTTTTTPPPSPPSSFFNSISPLSPSPLLVFQNTKEEGEIDTSTTQLPIDPTSTPSTTKGMSSSPFLFLGYLYVLKPKLPMDTLFVFLFIPTQTALYQFLHAQQISFFLFLLSIFLYSLLILLPFLCSSLHFSSDSLFPLSLVSLFLRIHTIPSFLSSSIHGSLCLPVAFSPLFLWSRHPLSNDYYHSRILPSCFPLREGIHFPLDSILDLIRQSFSSSSSPPPSKKNPLKHPTADPSLLYLQQSLYQDHFSKNHSLLQQHLFIPITILPPLSDPYTPLDLSFSSRSVDSIPYSVLEIDGGKQLCFKQMTMTVRTLSKEGRTKDYEDLKMFVFLGLVDL